MSMCLTLMDFREPLNNRLPELARVQTWLLWALMVCTSSSDFTFHTLIVWSAEPLYMLSLGVERGIKSDTQQGNVQRYTQEDMLLIIHN